MPDYTKTTWVSGAAPGISAENLNKLEGQYDTVKAELQRADGTSAIQAHGSNLVADSVTDTKIGSRTVNPATATAYSLTGQITQHLSWIAKSIKALKGVAGNWYDACSGTIEGIWAKFHATTGHKHSGAAGDGPKIPVGNLDTDVATQAEMDAKLHATTGHKHSGGAGDAPK
ncbi:MAG: hypothetical protein WD024_06790, partial [Bacillota bacterium]